MFINYVYVFLFLGLQLVDENESYANITPIYNDSFKESHQKLIAPFKQHKVPILAQIVGLGVCLCL
jgi:hypothetical protein